MTDEKPRSRAGKPGGDKPMRRDAGGAKADDPKRDFKPRAQKFERAAPDGKSPRVEKSARPKPQKTPRAELTPTEKTSAFEGERIAKAMARAGVCSRRDAETWIAEGRVAVNGRVLTSPAVNVTESDRIEIDGAPMQARERTRLFLFHKPAGLVTTARDEEGRSTVFDYLAERHPDLPRLISVGRLDINTEGLLLLTNDGGLARTLELPATGWTRRYRVRAHGETDQARLDALREGVTIEDVTYAPIEARLEREQGTNVWIAMSLTEGKNREVKRVMGHLGLDVTRLIRVSYGPFQLGDLAEGAVEEVRLKTLREQLGKSLAELAGVDFGAPLREMTATEEQEKRERLDKRSRKHVSVLREERDEKRARGPRARLTTGATADRKGRAVAVERVTLVRPRREEAEPDSRNARRFAAMRDARGEGGRDRREGRSEKRDAEPKRAPRSRDGGRESTPHRFQGDARAAREHVRGRADGERNVERRPPRRDDDARRGDRPFERSGGKPREERAPRGEGFERRPPRRDESRNADMRGAASRASAGGSSRSEEGPPRRTRAPGAPERSDRPPRKPFGKSAPHKGGARSGPSKGPAKGPRNGPHKGPRKGPRKGPGKGPPRKPRG